MEHSVFANIDPDLVYLDFASAYEQLGEEALYLLQSLLLDDSSCLARIGFLHALRSRGEQEPDFKQYSMSRENWSTILHSLRDIGLILAVSKKLVTVDQLQALTCDPYALLAAHQVVTGDKEVDDFVATSNTRKAKFPSQPPVQPTPSREPSPPSIASELQSVPFFVQATPSREPPPPPRWPTWVALAVAVLVVCFVFWRDSAQAEKLYTIEKRQTEQIEQLIEELRNTGYLHPIVWVSREGDRGQKSPFLLASATEVFIAGWVSPDVIARIEVYWNGETEDEEPEIIFSSQAGEKNNRKSVPFHGRHSYKLDGKYVSPRVRAVPHKGTESILRDLRIGKEQLGGSATVRCSPWGIVFASDSISHNYDYDTAVWAIKHNGSVRIHVLSIPGQPDPKLDYTTLEDLPRKLKIQQLTLEGNKDIQNQDLAQLGNLAHLHGLGISSTSVTDEGLQYIGTQPSLKYLYLCSLKITDDGLKVLEGMKQVSLIQLDDSPITDAGLAQLQHLPLTWLSLERTKVTEKAVLEFSRKHPNCEIHFDNKTIVDGKETTKEP